MRLNGGEGERRRGGEPGPERAAGEGEVLISLRSDPAFPLAGEGAVAPGVESQLLGEKRPAQGKSGRHHGLVCQFQARSVPKLHKLSPGL